MEQAVPGHSTATPRPGSCTWHAVSPGKLRRARLTESSQPRRLQSWRRFFGASTTPRADSAFQATSESPRRQAVPARQSLRERFALRVVFFWKASGWGNVAALRARFDLPAARRTGNWQGGEPRRHIGGAASKGIWARPEVMACSGNATKLELSSSSAK